MKKPFRAFAVCSLGVAALACSGGALAQSYWRIDGGISKSRKADFKEEGTVLTCGNVACTDPAVFDDLKSVLAPRFRLGIPFRPLLPQRHHARFPQRLPSERERQDLRSLDRQGGHRVDGRDAEPVLRFSDRERGEPLLRARRRRLPEQDQRHRRDFGRGSGHVFSAPGGKKTNGAGALMAGISFETRGGGAVEFGFRVIDLGKIETDAGTTTTTTAGISSAGRALQRHEGPPARDRVDDRPALLVRALPALP